MFFTRKKYCLRIRDFWFCPDREKENEKGVDFVQYHDVDWNKFDDVSLISFTNGQTFVNDLLKSVDSLCGEISKNCLYEIKRAKREGYNVLVLSGGEILEQERLLRRVANQHSHMFKQKGLKAKDEYPTMYAAAQANMLTVSVCNTVEGKECVYHAYITGEGRARLLHSISLYRDANNSEERNAIGRANRLLHFEDMVWFKGHGYSMYDWGGYSAGKLRGIDEFKASFGGRLENRITAVFSTSIIGKVLGCVVK